MEICPMRHVLQEASSYQSFAPNLFNFNSTDCGLKRYILKEVSREKAEYKETTLIQYERGYIADVCCIYDCNKNLLHVSTADMDCSSLNFENISKYHNSDVDFVDKDVLFIFKSGKNNYGHLLVEILPKLELAYKNGLLENLILVLPTMSTSLQAVVSDVIRIYSQKIGKNIGTYSLLSPLTQFRTINYISSISKHNKLKSPVVLDFAKTIEDYYHDYRASVIAKKLYLFRSGVSNRSIINQKSVHQIAFDNGFVPIDLSLVSFKDQVIMMRTATHIIGDHGAALTNMLFSNDNCRIGMIDPGLYDFFFWDLACLKRQNFNWYFNELKMWSLEFSQARYTVNEGLLSCFFACVSKQ